MRKNLNLLAAISLLFLVFSVLPREAAAQGVTLSLFPSRGSFGIGEDFSVMVRVHTGGASINAAEATLNFPPDMLSVRSLSKSGSIFSLWAVEPTFSNSGIITFGGGTTTSFTGSLGTVLTITFKAKKEGEAQVAFSSARILAADGKGTDIFGGSSSASYGITSIAKPVVPSQASVKSKIISLTHSHEDAWYSNSNPEFSWVLPEGTTDVSFLLDRIPERNPDSLSEGLLDYKSYTEIEDGIWYFHLKLKNTYGWSSTTSYRIQIDTKPPRPFEITVLDDKKTTNPQPAILFDTVDDLSGIGYYEVQVGNNEKEAIEKSGGNPFQIAKQIPGTYVILVRAFDKAANAIQATSQVIIVPIEIPHVAPFIDTLFIGEKLQIKGTGIPEAIIELHVQGEKEQTTTVDEKGNWFIESERFYITKSHSFHVIQEDARGAKSMPSETFSFKILAFVNIGPWRVSSFLIILALGMLFGTSLLTLLFFRRKIRSIQKGVGYEIKDAQEKLHKSVDYIKEQITAKLRNLEHVKGTRRLSGEEIEMEKNLKKDLDKMEQFMKGEIGDIEGELNHIVRRHTRNRIIRMIQKWLP